MIEETNSPPTLTNELDAALKTLELALASAGGAMSTIRRTLPQVAVLAEVVAQIEEAMSRARQQLGAPAATPPSTPLQPVPPPAREHEREAVERAEQAHPDAHCLRLEVRTDAVDPLDLKAVDSALNQHPAVVDVALLDYDGGRATLKIWVESSMEPDAVREELLENLERRLDDAEAEIRIDFEERSAA